MACKAANDQDERRRFVRRCFVLDFGLCRRSVRSRMRVNSSIPNKAWGYRLSRCAATWWLVVRLKLFSRRCKARNQRVADRVPLRCNPFRTLAYRSHRC